LEFSWDENKNESNLIKHGLSFETAKLVFEDPFHLSRIERVVEGEVRWQTIGMVEHVLLILVAHTVSEDEDSIRLISARRASKKERRFYEQGS